jgi:biopolymer transport protein ExbD
MTTTARDAILDPDAVVARRPKKRRRSPRVDMTPLVDVGFQLITFFMLTTTFSLPQVMEINLPPSESRAEITEQSLLLLRVVEDGRVFWSFGTDPPRPIADEELRGFLIERANANPNLIALVKVDRKSKYTHLVRVVDELNVAKITRFSLAPLVEQDVQLIERATG